MKPKHANASNIIASHITPEPHYGHNHKQKRGAAPITIKTTFSRSHKAFKAVHDRRWSKLYNEPISVSLKF